MIEKGSVELLSPFKSTALESPPDSTSIQKSTVSAYELGVVGDSAQISHISKLFDVQREVFQLSVKVELVSRTFEGVNGTIRRAISGGAG